LIFSVPNGIPVGEKTFTSMNIIASGFISLGPVGWYVRYMYQPWSDGFSSFYRVPMIAPFWDDFHPSLNYEGRVYYHVSYHTRAAPLTGKWFVLPTRVSISLEFFQSFCFGVRERQ